MESSSLALMALPGEFFLGYLLTLQTIQRSQSFHLNTVHNSLDSHLHRILIATIRDLGICPCPRCRVNKLQIRKLRTITDLRNCQREARHDDIEYRNKIEAAHAQIYVKGHRVTSKPVQDLLKSESLVPTRVSRTYPVMSVQHLVLA